MAPILLFATGAVSISTGAWMAWHPAGPLVAGLCLVFLSIHIARGSSSN